MRSNVFFIGDGGSDEHHGAHTSGMTPLWLTCHLKADTIAHRQLMLQDKVTETFTTLGAVLNWLPE